MVSKTRVKKKLRIIELSSSMRTNKRVTWIELSTCVAKPKLLNLLTLSSLFKWAKAPQKQDVKDHDYRATVRGVK